jgi:hypothetical protein
MGVKFHPLRMELHCAEYARSYEENQGYDTKCATIYSYSFNVEEGFGFDPHRPYQKSC